MNILKIYINELGNYVVKFHQTLRIQSGEKKTPRKVTICNKPNKKIYTFLASEKSDMEKERQIKLSLTHKHYSVYRIIAANKCTNLYSPRRERRVDDDRMGSIEFNRRLFQKDPLLKLTNAFD